MIRQIENPSNTIKIGLIDYNYLALNLLKSYKNLQLVILFKQNPFLINPKVFQQKNLLAAYSGRWFQLRMALTLLYAALETYL